MNPEESLIAPCGMNCALCIAYQRPKNRCLGCYQLENSELKHTRYCRIRYCPERLEAGISFCSECSKYPCKRMKDLDKRYRTKYGMSMLENLKFIQDKGLDLFIQKEAEKWKCPSCGELLCVHRAVCQHCQEKL